jgi:hypothetical protein
MRFFFGLLVVLLSSFAVHAQGFSSGDQFTAEPIYGFLKVNCNNTNTAAFQCRDLLLLPTTMDYFIGPAGIDADEVELAATHENGEIIKKVSSYKNGSSTNRFNLGNLSLFQSPLLANGKNSIQYYLKKMKRIVQEGNFQIFVRQGQTRNCRDGSINTTDMNLCNSPYSACQRYFYEQNYCK